MSTRFYEGEREAIVTAASCALEVRANEKFTLDIDRDFVCAEILASLGLDSNTLTAALLRTASQHYHPQGNQNSEPLLLVDWVQTTFGAEVFRLLQNAQKARQIEALSTVESESEATHNARLERLRKMLLAMAEDIRVVFIMLCERVALMRFLSAYPVEQQKQIAAYTMNLFSPLANRLGMGQLKWELEDLAFRYLEPVEYKRIAKLLDEKRVARESFVTNAVSRLKQLLIETDIQGEVSGRPKHIYSIYRKMQRKEVDIKNLYDLRAVRVMVKDIADCYTILSHVHDIWEPIPSEFDDYIAKPKANNYRSLHTAVFADGQTLEVQIRTYKMHEESELGIAAHWRYKEGGKSDKAFDSKIAWLRKFLDWKTDIAESNTVPQVLKSQVFDESVYVLTPEGRIVDLPVGATPIDFAYHVHTSLGHRCRGAKVDGNIVPLNYKLQNAQTVEILAAKQGGPSRDWLNPEQGYLVSPRALAKVRHWFKQQFIEQEIVNGRAILEKDLAKLGATEFKLEKLAHELHVHDVNEMLVAIARGEVSHKQIEQVIAPPVLIEDASPVLPFNETGQSYNSSGVLVHGVGNITTVLAKCCKPVPPDPIVGFVSKSRGVMIHRADCSNVTHLDETQQERMMPVSWGKTSEAPFSTDIEVIALDRQGLLRDISEAISREKVNVTAVNSRCKNNQAFMRFTVQVTKLEHIVRIIKMIHEVPGIISARRG